MAVCSQMTHAHRYSPADEEFLSGKAGYLDSIARRFPRRSEVLAVFGVVVFVCYTWALLGFLNKLSSFLLYFTLGDIGSIFAFMMAFTLLESLAVTASLALASAILPATWLKDGFAFKGFVILLVATAASILFQKLLLGNEFPPAALIAVFILVPLALSAGLIFVLQPRPRARRILNSILDRVQIMLFVYVPIGLLALIVVLYQNLL